MTNLWKYSAVIFAGLIIFAGASSNFILNIEKAETKIVGGEEAKLETSKHVVSIRLAIKDSILFGFGHICGGTLIGINFILTATHCLINFQTLTFRGAHEFTVVMGALNRFEKTADTLQFNVKYLHHRNFNVITMENDIALMILDGIVPVNHPTVIPIELDLSFPPDETLCTIHGWGATGFDEEGTEELRSAQINIVSKELCSQKYIGKIYPGMICAGSDAIDKKDTCQGDSGGPLVCNGKLVGIVSWGEKCAYLDYPGVYSSVSYFYDWIQEQICKINVAKNFDGRKHLASIRLKSMDEIKYGSGHICGGALFKPSNYKNTNNLDSLRIVTAAHCLYNPYDLSLYKPENLTIVLGSLNLQLKTNNTLEFNVTSFKIHEDYNININILANNIAILELNGSTPKKLPTVEEQIPINIDNISLCQVDGWSKSFLNPVAYNELQTANVSAITQDLCGKLYKGLPSGIICAGDLQMLQDVINSDDGGPLTCTNKIAGILIRRFDSVYRGYPSIYTDVYYYEDWLKNNSDYRENQHQEKNKSLALISSVSSLIIVTLIAYIIY